MSIPDPNQFENLRNQWIECIRRQYATYLGDLPDRDVSIDYSYEYPRPNVVVTDNTYYHFHGTNWQTPGFTYTLGFYHVEGNITPQSFIANFPLNNITIDPDGHHDNFDPREVWNRPITLHCLDQYLAATDGNEFRELPFTWGERIIPIAIYDMSSNKPFISIAFDENTDKPLTWHIWKHNYNY